MSSYRSPKLHHKLGRFLGTNFQGFKGIDFILRKIHHPDNQQDNYFTTTIRGIPDGALYEIESRWFTEWQTYFYGSQDRNIHKWIIQNAKSDWVAFDIGMNYGYFTCLLSKKCNAVFGFEPVPWLAERAEKNCTINEFENAFIHNIALSNSDGLMKLNLPTKDDSNWGTSSLVHSSSSEDFIMVKTSTIDDFCSSNKIDRLDFIKLDVEGAENLVLSGAKNSLLKFRPKIIFENNSESINEVMAILRSSKYRFYGIKGEEIDQSIIMPHDILAIPQ